MKSCVFNFSQKTYKKKKFRLNFRFRVTPILHGLPNVRNLSTKQ